MLKNIIWYKNEIEEKRVFLLLGGFEPGSPNLELFISVKQV